MAFRKRSIWLGDQQVSKQIAVPLRQRDRLEVPLVRSCPWRAVLHQSAANLPNSRPAFIHLHHASLDQLHCRAGSAPSGTGHDLSGRRVPARHVERVAAQSSSVRKTWATFAVIVARSTWSGGRSGV